MTVEEIKDTTSMFDVLGRFGIKVNRSGMCSCPFHKDKKPSMKVYKDGYKCFSCNRAGDIFGFVQEYENCSFRDAFLFLGGTYENTTERQKALNQMKFSINKKKHKQKVDSSEEFYRMMVYTYGKIQEVIRNEIPYTSKWCMAQNMLPQIEMIWECKYIRNEEVNEIDGIRLYRQVRREFDS